MTNLSVGDTQINYTTHGNGPGLVLVHGTSVDAQTNYGSVIDQFSDMRRVICPNYAGCGGSTIPAGELQLATLVEQIAATIRHAEDGPVDLLGDSLGAVVAAATAARHPELVRTLILVAGWADSSDARHQLIFKTWAKLQSTDQEMSNRYALPLAVSPAFLTRLGTETLDALLQQPAPVDTVRRIELGLRIDIREQVKTIKVPTLVIACKQDYIIPLYQTQALRDLISGCLYTEVDSGHAAFLEVPDALVKLVRRFLLG